MHLRRSFLTLPPLLQQALPELSFRMLSSSPLSPIPQTPAYLLTDCLYLLLESVYDRAWRTGGRCVCGMPGRMRLWHTPLLFPTFLGPPLMGVILLCTRRLMCGSVSPVVFLIRAVNVKSSRAKRRPCEMPESACSSPSGPPSAGAVAPLMVSEARASCSSPGGVPRATVVAEILHLQRALEEMNEKISATAAGNAKLEAESSTLAEYLDALMNRAVNMGGMITSKREAKVLRSNLDLAARRRNMELISMAADETSAAARRQLSSSPAPAGVGDAASPYAQHSARGVGEPLSLDRNAPFLVSAPHAVSAPLSLVPSTTRLGTLHVQAPPPPPRMPPPPPLIPAAPHTPPPHMPLAHTPPPPQMSQPTQPVPPRPPQAPRPLPQPPPPPRTPPLPVPPPAAFGREP